MSEITFDTNNQAQVLHRSDGLSTKITYLEKNSKESHNVAKEIVTDIFNEVFYITESNEVKIKKGSKGKAAVGDNKLHSKIIACVHNFDQKDDDDYENLKNQNHDIMYTSGEPILLGYHKSNSNDIETADNVPCEICDNQSKYIIPKDHACPKKFSQDKKTMASEVTVVPTGITTIQRVFETTYDYENPSASGLSNTNEDDRVDDEDLEEKECKSLGTLEQKSDIFDLVKNQSMKSVSASSKHNKANEEDWENTEETLIQVIELEWVDPPPPGKTITLPEAQPNVKDIDEENDETEYVPLKFDEENMDVINLNDTEAAVQGGKGDDMIEKLSGRNDRPEDRIEEAILSDTEEKTGNSSQKEPGSKMEGSGKKKKWNFANKLRCFFSKKRNITPRSDSVNN